MNFHAVTDNQSGETKVNRCTGRRGKSIRQRLQYKHSESPAIRERRFAICVQLSMLQNFQMMSV